MQTAKRVVAFIFMLVAVLGILAGLVGIAVVWVAKERWTGEALSALGGLESELKAADEALREAEPRLAAGREGLDAISTAAVGVGEKLEEPRLVGLAQDVQGTLSAIDGEVRAVDARLREVEAGVNKLVDLVNKLPRVEVPVLDVKLLDGVGDMLGDASGRVQSLADEVTGGKVAVTEEMAGIRGAVQQADGELAAIGSSISAARTDLAAGRDTLRAWGVQLADVLGRAATTLTVLLIWFVIGQVALFMWMWSVYPRDRR